MKTQSYCSFTPAHPLTSTSSCTKCVRLSERIAELEGRVSTLYQIKEDEQLIDYLVATAATDATVAEELDPTVSCLDTAPTRAGDYWTQLGPDPRPCSPCQTEPLIVARGNKRCGKRSSCHPPLWDLKLDNMFSILEEVEGPSLENLSGKLPASPIAHFAPSRPSVTFASVCA